MFSVRYRVTVSGGLALTQPEAPDGDGVRILSARGGGYTIRSVSSLGCDELSEAKTEEWAASAQANSIPCFGPAPTMRAITASVTGGIAAERF